MNDAASLCLVCQNGSMVPAPVGTAFQVALYYAPDGTSESMFDVLAIRLGAPASFFPIPGRFTGGIRTAPTAEPGGFGLFQVRGWQAAFGSSYEDVFNSGRGMVGKSSILRIDTGDPTTFGIATPLVAAGFQGLSISYPEPCPEPTSGILGGAAILAVLLVRGVRRR